MTVFVISLNTTRQGSFSSSFSIFARCHEIASPSRSGSVASTICFACFASLRIFSITSPLPRRVIYLGSKSCSTSTPSWLFGKSRTCPFDAMTLYFEPRYFSIVFALDGDSTITNVSAIILLRPFGRLQLIYSKIRFLPHRGGSSATAFFHKKRIVQTLPDRVCDSAGDTTYGSAQCIDSARQLFY